MLRRLFLPVVFLVGAGTLLGQSAPSTTTPPAQNGPGRGENCFQQASLERSVMEQVRSIVHEAHTQIAGVCSNSSLTPQQKNQQVREIREKAMQEREGLMTAEQQKAVAACQQARHANHPAGNGAHEGLMGGCGEMPRGGSQPGGALHGATRSGTSNAPLPSQSSPQN